MNQTFDEQLQFLMDNDPDEYHLTVDSISSENHRVFYTIHSMENDDFLLTASVNENDEDDYVTETDYDNLIHDFRNDTITHITVWQSYDIIKEFKAGIPVDYTRKMPKKLDDCPICLESLIVDVCANRKCRHLYHCECISKWNGENCPVCRRTLDLYKLQDIDDYSRTAGFTLFGKISEIKYLQKVINGIVN